jgi:alpha-galactosidase
LNTTKIAVIGAGSMSFGISMFKDIFSSTELAGSVLSLMDIDEAALDRMYRLAKAMNHESRAALRIEKTTDRRQALEGAGFVVTSIAIERCRLWRQDFHVPHKFGIRHTLGENGGPGALFFTLRTIPVMMDISKDMEELCPDAWLLNFSNPESRIILALGRYSKIKSIGLCHGIFMGHESVARILDRPYQDVEVMGVGLNHFQWLTEIRDTLSGQDLYPEFAAKEQDFDPSFEPFSRNLFRAFGKFPSCSDDHIGEYLPYGWEAGEKGYDFDADDQGRIATIQEVELRLKCKSSFADWLQSSGERAVQIITAVLHNKHLPIESAVIYNQGAIANLPVDAAVEVPVVASAAGILPVRIADLPAPLARMLLPQVGVQQMAVEAAVYGDKDMALQALLMDPVVNSATAARRILDELWEINKPYIRHCI